MHVGNNSIFKALSGLRPIYLQDQRALCSAGNHLLVILGPKDIPAVLYQSQDFFSPGSYLVECSAK